MTLFAACAALVSCKSGCTGERDPQPEVWHVDRIAWKLAGPAVKKGFSCGVMDYEGNWLYKTTVFNSFPIAD